MRKGEKDLVSAAADAEVGTAVHRGADPVRSPVHAALQHSGAEDEVTIQQLGHQTNLPF